MLCFLTWCKNETEKAADYNDAIISFVEDCTDSEEDLFNLLSENANASTLSASLDIALSACKKSQNALEQMDDFNGDSTFKDLIKNLIDTEISYLKLIEQSLAFVDLDTLTSAQKEEYSRIYEEMNFIENQNRDLAEKITREQETFANQYGFILQS